MSLEDGLNCFGCGVITGIIGGFLSAAGYDAYQHKRNRRDTSPIDIVNNTDFGVRIARKGQSLDVDVQGVVKWECEIPKKYGRPDTAYIFPSMVKIQTPNHAFEFNILDGEQLRDFIIPVDPRLGSFENYHNH